MGKLQEYVDSQVKKPPKRRGKGRKRKALTPEKPYSTVRSMKKSAAC